MIFKLILLVVIVFMVSSIFISWVNLLIKKWRYKRALRPCHICKTPTTLMHYDTYYCNDCSMKYFTCSFAARRMNYERDYDFLTKGEDDETQTR